MGFATKSEHKLQQMLGELERRLWTLDDSVVEMSRQAAPYYFCPTDPKALSVSLLAHSSRRTGPSGTSPGARQTALPISVPPLREESQRW